MDQGFEYAVVQSDGGRNGCRGKDGAVKPAGEQAGDDDHRAQHARRNQGTRSGEPHRETLVAAEQGDDGRVDNTIEPVRRRLVCEQRAEDSDEDRATG